MIANIVNFAFVLAQATTDTGGGDNGGDQTSSAFNYSSIIMILAFGAIFYFLLIRPGQKQRKAHDNLVSAVKKGDEIMTAGGFYGTVTQVRDDYVMVEVAKKTLMKLSRNSIARIVNPDEVAAEEAEAEVEDVPGEEEA